MNRCAPSLLALALAGAAALLATVPATAAQATIGVRPTTAASAPLDVDSHRKFTKDALRGKITFGATPSIALNGTATLAARGARIHDEQNRLVIPSSLDGSTHIVNYTLDKRDRVYEIWILTAEEAAKRPWPRSEAEAKSWTFDAASQTWTPS